MEILGNDTTTIRIAHIAQLCAQSQRSAPLRSRVLLNAPNNCIMRGHALEITASRLIVSIPSSLSLGDECAALITITAEDDTFGIVGTAQVVSCVGCEGDGYHAVMRFIVEDEQSRHAIEQLFGSPAESTQ